MQNQLTFIPMRAVYVGKNLKPKWLSREIENAIRRKRISYRRAKIFKNFEGYIYLAKRVKALINPP